ncbi:MAG: T9SS type A sorting domain-containing protein, partial [Bacteroidales bacterium]|nr:T9SS type A sorting domain-containing protein [Bacteroidales bacterium]
TASNSLTVAGLYIGIQYNPAVLTIQGYETTPEAMEYNTIETPGLLGFHWMTNPQMELLTLKKNDPVITLTVTVAENATPQTITFTLDEESNYISAAGKTLKSNPLFAQSLEVLKNENTTTINETSDRVSLYPNPASEYLIIGTHNLNQKIVIHDMTGKTVCEASLTTLQTRLNVSSFKPGYYFYQIINKDDGTIDHSGKLAVTR